MGQGRDALPQLLPVLRARSVPEQLVGEGVGLRRRVCRVREVQVLGPQRGGVRRVQGQGQGQGDAWRTPFPVSCLGRGLGGRDGLDDLVGAERHAGAVALRPRDRLIPLP